MYSWGRQRLIYVSQIRVQVSEMAIVLICQSFRGVGIAYLSTLQLSSDCRVWQGQRALNRYKVCNICGFYICWVRILYFFVSTEQTSSTVGTYKNNTMFNNIQGSIRSRILSKNLLSSRKSRFLRPWSSIQGMTSFKLFIQSGTIQSSTISSGSPWIVAGMMFIIIQIFSLVW